MPSTVAQLAVQVTSNTDQAVAALAGLTTVMRGVKYEALGMVLGVAAIGAVGGISLKMAGDFQFAMTRVSTGAGLAAKDIGYASGKVLQMAIDTGTSTKQLTDGLYMISSAGYNTTQSLQILKMAAEGAKVGQADLGTVADATTTIMRDYQTANISAAQAVNLLIQTESLGKTHMQDIASAISTVLPAAAKFGVSLTDVMAALATMTAHGVAAANATTYLRQMIVSLNAPTGPGIKALASIGLTAQQVSDTIRGPGGLPAALQLITDRINATFKPGSTAAMTAFKEIAGGSRQMMGMLNLTGSSMQMFAADAAKMKAAVAENAKGITNWSLIQSTLNQHLDVLRSVLEVIMINLGTKLIPVATAFVGFLTSSAIPAIQNFITMIQGSSTQAQILRPILIVLAVAIAGALVAAFIMWAGAAALAAAATIAATWPILLAGAAIALLIAGLIYAYKNWGFFRFAVDQARIGLGAIMGFIGSIVLPLLGRLASFIGTTVGDAFRRFGDGVKFVTNFVGGLISGIRGLLSALGSIVGAVGGAIGSLRNLANVGSTVGGILSHIPHFATGGTMTDTGVALVGEAGPELVQLPGGSKITPLTAGNAISGLPSGMAGAMSGGANQQMQSTFIIQLDGRQIATATIKHLPGLVRLATGTRSF